ncbi:MAG TPA: DNA recombination protein RmuC [Pseudolabrys sp.]|jgi:DNA recombination protein RmuC
MAETSLLIALGVLLLLGLAAVIVLLLRPRAPVADPAAEQRLVALNSRLDGMANWLQNAHGQLQQTVQTSQGQFQQTVNERLDAVTARLGESLSASTNTTAEHLQNLHARLAVIDSAQKNIADLASQVSLHVGSLNNILANKQSRGAFGQGQLEAIVADLLPKGAYEFQHTLTNKMRPDCVIFVPDSGHLVIDAKFPLEAMTAWRDAASDDDRKIAIQRVRQDIGKHVTDIAEKYMIAGETQDVALMFIPSESLYADIYDSFDDVVQRARRARVMIVSPNMAVLAIQLVRQMRKDAQMREAVDQIRFEIGHMMKDVALLGDRVRKLQGHFGQTTKDMDDILTSAGRIEKRAGRIEGLDFEAEAASGAIAAAVPKLGAAE